uniref:MarR family transcriptional regulator n=1 Tax=Streptomyces sp. NBC_00180 TaxID=2903632 RepID=A0AAU1HXL0_9ACTN
MPCPHPATGPDRPDIPDHPVYQQILTALAVAGRPMRARDPCRALDLPILPN